MASREEAIFQSILKSKGLAAARAWAKKQPKDKAKPKKKSRGKGYVPRGKRDGHTNPFASKGEPQT